MGSPGCTGAEAKSEPHAVSPVFSPRSRLRGHVAARKLENESQENFQSSNKAYSMTWAKRLKRVFAIEIEKCDRYGGKVKIIASLGDPDVIEKILKHLGPG